MTSNLHKSQETKSLYDAACEVKAALDLPEGYWVRIDEATDFILVGTNDLAFAISHLCTKDGVHVQRAQEMLPELKRAMALPHEPQNAPLPGREI